MSDHDEPVYGSPMQIGPVDALRQELARTRQHIQQATEILAQLPAGDPARAIWTERRKWETSHLAEVTRTLRGLGIPIEEDG